MVVVIMAKMVVMMDESGKYDDGEFADVDEIWEWKRRSLFIFLIQYLVEFFLDPQGPTTPSST